MTVAPVPVDIRGRAKPIVQRICRAMIIAMTVIIFDFGSRPPTSWWDAHPGWIYVFLILPQQRACTRTIEASIFQKRSWAALINSVHLCPRAIPTGILHSRAISHCAQTALCFHRSGPPRTRQLPGETSPVSIRAILAPTPRQTPQHDTARRS
jgi:hypothetical protein